MVCTKPSGFTSGIALDGNRSVNRPQHRFVGQRHAQRALIAFLVVALIAGLMFRSLRMVVITLIPNFIPLLLIAGIMGWFDIDLKLSTSIIYTIAFGIAVDDTIHL